MNNFTLTNEQLSALASDTLTLTGSHGQIHNLAGQSRKQIRRALMERLTGEHRPLAKCGVNALEHEYMRVYKVLNGSTIRERENNLSTELKHMSNIKY